MLWNFGSYLHLLFCLASFDTTPAGSGWVVVVVGGHTLIIARWELTSRVFTWLPLAWAVWREMGVGSLHCCWTGLGVLALHWASADITLAGSWQGCLVMVLQWRGCGEGLPSLVLGGGESLVSPLGFLDTIPRWGRGWFLITCYCWLEVGVGWLSKCFLAC